MSIITVRYTTADNDIVVVEKDDGNGVENLSFDSTDTSSHEYELLQRWLAKGNAISPYVQEPEPTNAELIDMAGPVMMAFLKAYAKREGLTMQQIKNAILAEMPQNN